MTQLFTNNAYSALAASISDTATSITLTPGTGVKFPTPAGGDFFLLTLINLDGNLNEIGWEVVKVTARTADSLTVVRAQESTTAVSWSSGTRVELRITAASLNSFLDAADAAALCLPLVGGTVTGDTRFTSTGALRISAGTTEERPEGEEALLRFNKSLGKFEGHNGDKWGSIGGSDISTFLAYKYVASSNQTVFSGADENALTLAYTPGTAFLTLNGVVLLPGVEYTATNGTSFTLASPAAEDDELLFFAFGNFLIADTYSRAEAESTFATTGKAIAMSIVFGV